MSNNQSLFKKIVLTNSLGIICFYIMLIMSALYIDLPPTIVEIVTFVTFIAVNFVLLKHTTFGMFKKVISSITLSVLVMLGGFALYNLSASSISEDAAYMKNVPNIVPSKQ